MPSRRQVLAVAPLVLAGCSNTLSSGDGTPTTTASAAALPAGLTTTDRGVVVDATAMTTGEISVSEEVVYEYGTPVEVTFRPAAVYRGSGVEAPQSSDTLRVSSMLPDDSVPTACPVPLLTDETFEYRFYVNTAFRELADWHVAAGLRFTEDEDAVNSQPATFEAVGEGVSVTSVTNSFVEAAGPTDPLSTLLANYGGESLSAGEEPDDITAVASVPRSGEQSTVQQAPQARFVYEYRGDELVIVHDGGDSIAGAHLDLLLGGEAAGVEFPRTVSAGTAITVDISGVERGTEIRLVWSADGTTATIGHSQVP